MFLVALLDGPLSGNVLVDRVSNYHFLPLSNGNYAFYYIIHKNSKVKEIESSREEAIRKYNSSKPNFGRRKQRPPKLEKVEASYKFLRKEFPPDHQDVLLHLQRKAERQRQKARPE